VANGALDFAQNGFYAGTWWADVGQGLEIDGYGGYAHDFGSFRYTVGYTGYFYSDDFDDTYQEINLKAGYGPFGVEYNVGQYDNFAGPVLDYSFATLGVTFAHLHALLGAFAQDFDGGYLQFGYATQVAGFNLGIDAIYSSADLVGDEANATLVLSIGKLFAIGATAGTEE
jgi:hypothetical protein